MYAYFKDNELQQAFDKNGYVRIKVLDNEALKTLTALYNSIKPIYIRSTFCNLYSRKATINDTISKKIKGFVEQFVATNLIDCEIIGACYIAKGKGAKTNVDYHQDWAITNEKMHYSLAVWVPLADTDKQNGALTVIPGSHKWPNVIRSFNMPSLYVGINKVALPNQVTLDLKAGEAVIYAQNIFHASWPNLSNKNRVAVNITVLPKLAEKIFFNKKSNGSIETFIMPDNFHNDMIIGLKKGKYPDSLIKKDFTYDEFGNITEEQFFNLLKITA